MKGACVVKGGHPWQKGAGCVVEGCVAGKHACQGGMCGRGHA